MNRMTSAWYIVLTLAAAGHLGSTTEVRAAVAAPAAEVAVADADDPTHGTPAVQDADLTYHGGALAGLVAALTVAVAGVILARRRHIAMARSCDKLQHRIDEQSVELREARDAADAAGHELNERLRELTFKQRVVETCRTKPSPRLLLQAIASLMPTGCHRPKIATARIRFEGDEFTSKTFEETPWCWERALIVGGEPAGVIQVYRLEPPDGDGAPVFADEDARLLEEATESLGEAIDRVRANRELLQSRQRLALHIERTPLGVIQWDRNFQVEQWNHAAERIFGFTQEDAIGRHPAGLIVPEDAREHVDRVWSQLCSHTGGDHRIDKNVTQNGDVILCEWFNTPLVHTDGTLLGVASFVQDITERKRAEDRLVAALDREKRTSHQLEATMHQLQKATEDAKAAAQAKSEFLANMSHEIRTPMTAILGYTDHLLDPNLPETERRAAIHTIQQNGDHLLDIINDILDISKIDAGKLSVTRGPCSPIRIVNEVQSLMQVRAAAKRLRFDVCFGGPIPEAIQSNATRIKQVLINLVGNAIKFTEQGSVEIHMRCESAESPEPRMRFDVVDTGIGIKQEEGQTLFDAFTQVDASSTRRFGGSGLGLTISKHLADKLGGAVTFVSRPGEGSTFTFTVATGPLHDVLMVENGAVSPDPVGVEAASLREASSIKLSGIRVLVVEDNPTNRILIVGMLKKAGAEVVAVENGQLAVASALDAQRGGNAFDVILMDVQMPVMDGFEATASLRRRAYDLPIIALTAHAMDSDRQKCLEAGYDDHTTKPINRPTLLTLVREYAAKVTTHGQT